MNPFTYMIDFLDDNADFMAPVGAFIGLAIAFTIAIIGAK